MSSLTLPDSRHNIVGRCHRLRGRRRCGRWPCDVAQCGLCGPADQIGPLNRSQLGNALSLLHSAQLATSSIPGAGAAVGPLPLHRQQDRRSQGILHACFRSIAGDSQHAWYERGDAGWLKVVPRVFKLLGSRSPSLACVLFGRSGGSIKILSESLHNSAHVLR